MIEIIENEYWLIIAGLIMIVIGCYIMYKANPDEQRNLDKRSKKQ